MDNLPVQGGEEIANDSNYHGLTLLAKGGLIGFVGLFTGALLNLIFQLVLARSLGPSELGIYNWGYSYTSFITLFILFGLDFAIVNRLARYLGNRDYSKARGVIIVSQVVMLVSGVLITPLFLVSSDLIASNIFHKPGLGLVLRILILCSPFTALTTFYIAIAQAFKQVVYKYLIESLLLPLMKIFVLLWFVKLIGSNSLAGAYALLISISIVSIITTLLVFRYYKNQLDCPGQVSSPLNIVKEMLQVAIPLLFGVLFYTLNSQTETILLGIFSTPDQVGIYSVALRATILITVFLQALTIIFAPVISELYAKGELLLLEKQFRAVTRWSFILAFPWILLTVNLSKDLMAIFGPKFVYGSTILQILAIANIVYLVAGPSGWVLGMTRYANLVFINSILALIFSIIVDLIFIPEYGALGAAIGGALSILFYRLLEFGEVLLLLKLNPLDRHLLKPLIAGIFAIFVLLGGNYLMDTYAYIWRLISLIPAFLITYGITLTALGLNVDDRNVLTIILRRFQLKN